MRSIAYLIVVLLLFNIGCESFLQEENLSYMSEEDFYKTSQDAENALNAIYNLLTDQGAYGTSYWMVRITSDEGIYVGRTRYLSLANSSYGSSNSEIEKVWNSFYLLVHASNIVIEKVPNIEMDSARKVVILSRLNFFVD